MTYDNWKTESPEDERERTDSRSAKREDRLRYLEDHADEINEERRERRRRDD